MARFTNIGMPRKSFVASAAEEAATKPESESQDQENQDAGPSKRKGWGRDPEIAKRARQNMDRTDVRREQRAEMRVQQTTCFACRGVGHAARECPNILLAAAGEAGSAAMLEAPEMLKRKAEAEAVEEDEGKKAKKAKKGKKDKGEKKDQTGGEITGGKCYRCNSKMHSLYKCPKRADPKNPTPYATCFVCLGEGHLSSACPKNPRGVYVNGGSCKLCESVQHRAKDCPTLHRPELARPRRGEVVLGTGAQAGADEDDFMVTRRQEKEAGIRRHAPANNAQRGPAKKPGEEGAFAAEPELVAEAPKPKPKKKVVKF